MIELNQKTPAVGDFMSALFFIYAVVLQADQLPNVSASDSGIQIEAAPKPQKPGDTQEAASLESRSTAEWRTFLLQWRQRAVAGTLPGYALPEDELALIARVRDGNAAFALAALYKQERHLRVRMAYVGTLSQIQTTKALQTLVQVSLEDSDPRLRNLAAEGTAKTQDRKTAAELYARAIRNGRHRQYALEAIEKAGLVSPLSSSEAPNPALVTALIDSLWVTVTQLVECEFSSDWVTPSGGSSIINYNMLYGRRAFPFRQLVKVPTVHETLQRYTNEDYGYDQDAWRRWYKTRQRDVGVRDVP